jgi:hypothetical protein
MARARTVRPEFFRDEVLGVADPLYSLVFEGLWMLAGATGELPDDAAAIKSELFPYRRKQDVSTAIDWLAAVGYIQRRAGNIAIVTPERWYSTPAPEVVSATTAARRARVMRALPAWADRAAIRAIYAQAREATVETGIEHHVDHDIPLAGEVVCGLHVASNLRVLPAPCNLKKSNKFEGSNG